MSKFKPLLPQSGPPKITLSGIDYKFWFSSDIRDWMPKFREQREQVRNSMSKKRERNTIGFRRANNGMACSERRLVK